MCEFIWEGRLVGAAVQLHYSAYAKYKTIPATTHNHIMSDVTTPFRKIQIVSYPYRINTPEINGLNETKIWRKKNGTKHKHRIQILASQFNYSENLG